MIICPTCHDDLRLEGTSGRHRLICRGCGWWRAMLPFDGEEDQQELPVRGPSPRNREIVRRVQAGERQTALAREFGISPQRVGQIVARWGAFAG